jgi:serine phosphatase RsbU (regulator of sigma subunit)/transcriptional regulator with XRE-family HTH domain
MPPPLSQALTFLRSAAGWTPEELADAVGLPPEAVSALEEGGEPPSRARLEALAGAMGVAPERVEVALFCAALLAPGGKEDRSDRSDPTDRSAEKADAAARVEKLCAESIAAAADEAGRALELAELAVQVAELAPGGEGWRSRLQGYAWAHAANARRVAGDLTGADAACAHAWKLWQAGAAGDPDGVLEETTLLRVEASLRRTQRRDRDSLALLERALVQCRTAALRAEILVRMALTFETMGEYPRAIAALEESAPLIDGETAPRLLAAQRFNLMVNLCFVGRFAEAAEMLPGLRLVMGRLGNRLDDVRLRWLEGRIAAGLGRVEEAIASLVWVRAEFDRRGMFLDSGLAMLELAEIYLERGETAAVKELAREVTPIFEAQEVHLEAIRALALFRDAAERETLTREQTRLVAAALREELETARRIQLSILPAAPPCLPGLEVAVRYLPASAVSGDFYDFLPVDPAGGRRLAVIVADVSGHGVPAALISSMLKVAAAAQAAHAASPARVLAEMGRIFRGRLQSHFVTAACLFFDLEAGRLVSASAGHPPPLLWKAAEGTVEELAQGGGGGTGLGRLAPTVPTEYRESAVALAPGDRVLLFTDGLSEARDRSGEPFGDSRLRPLFAACAHLAPELLADALLEQIGEWTRGNAGFEDDLTLVVLGVG